MTPDFVAIATPLVERGFRVTPVHALTKQGVMRNWNNKQITTPKEVLAFAKYYHSHNVAVVGKRAVYDRDGKFIPRHCFFDDDSGIAARIEEECGQKIPQTYRVNPAQIRTQRNSTFTSGKRNTRSRGSQSSQTAATRINPRM
jgi:Bifunctional DNA primase/polymerase, N-terminal